MSTYTHRYIEVRREKIDGCAWKFKNLPNPAEHKGEVFKITEYNRPDNVSPFYKAEEVCSDKKGSTVVLWVPLDKVDSEWVPVKWYSYLPKNKVLANTDPYFKPKYNVAKDAEGNEFFIQEHLLWANNGGAVRDDYISSSGWSKSKFSGRGLPGDVSDEVKNDILSDYHYDITWVTLSEWEEAFDAAKDKFQRELEKRFEKQSKDEISRKLDNILNTLKNPDYKPRRVKKSTDDDDYYFEDTVEYMFDEEIWTLFVLQMEIDRTEFILEEFGDWWTSQDVRIIYYLA